MRLVAAEAGVAVQTVYFTFGTKADLLAAVEEHAVLGDWSRADFFARWAEQLRLETDARALTKSFVANDTAVKQRLAPLVHAIGRFLPADTANNERRDTGRDRFFRSYVERLLDLGALRTGLTPERALDIVNALNSLASFTELTRRRGWSADEWGAWMCETLVGQLIAIR